MNWKIEREHCIKKKWEWSLNLIDRCQREMRELEAENKKLKEQLKASRLYTACNF